jgi:hypothetical protein
MEIVLNMCLRPVPAGVVPFAAIHLVETLRFSGNFINHRTFGASIATSAEMGHGTDATTAHMLLDVCIADANLDRV